MKPNPLLVGLRIKGIRESIGVNQKEFAKLINGTVPAVSNWENGRSLPNKERLKKIVELGNTIGELTTSELLYGSIEEYILNEINNYFENQDGIKFSSEGRKIVMKDALKQSLNNEFITATFGDESQEYLFNSFLHDEINKAISRYINLTDYTNDGFIRFTIIELSDLKNQLKGYLKNGINKDIYDETINIINKASDDIKKLK